MSEEYYRKALELFNSIKHEPNDKDTPNYNINIVIQCDSMDKKLYKVLKKYGIR